MAYTIEEIQTNFNDIIEDISTSNKSLRASLRDRGGKPSSATFYLWMEEDEDKLKQYARACEIRAENIFDEIMEIADDQSGDEIIDADGNRSFNQEFAARSRIKIDARKWMLGKMNPKKYSDRHINVIEGGDKPITISFID